jgi:predicted O-methyltransferase YrrM
VITAGAVESYLEDLHEGSDAVLREMEEHGARDGIPIVQRPTGALLHELAAAIGARRVVEIGTAIGVSTYYLASALPADGVVVSFDIDPERQGAARDYLERAGLGDRVDLRLQDAREGLGELEPGFDLAFLDGVKQQYDDYLELSLPLVRPGGLVVIDNVLMGGTVAENATDGHWTEDQIASQRALNERLLADDRLIATVTPVGDGVAIAVRR